MIGPISSGGHELVQRLLAAERGDLLDERAGDVRILAVGHQEDGLDLGVEPVVRQRHAELVFHVRQRPDASEDDPRPEPADELHGQIVERLDRHVRERGDDRRASSTRSSMSNSIALFGLYADADDQVVEQRRARRITSRWPSVSGSNVPVKTAVLRRQRS